MLYKLPSKVYFLFALDEPYFKIGFSLCPIRRAGALAEPIDIDHSFYVQSYGLVPARNIEKFLHAEFARFRISRNPHVCGHTEWFSEECFESIKSALSPRMCHVLDCSQVRRCLDIQKYDVADQALQKERYDQNHFWAQLPPERKLPASFEVLKQWQRLRGNYGHIPIDEMAAVSRSMARIFPDHPEARLWRSMATSLITARRSTCGGESFRS